MSDLNHLTEEDLKEGEQFLNIYLSVGALSKASIQGYMSALRDRDILEMQKNSLIITTDYMTGVGSNQI